MKSPLVSIITPCYNGEKVMHRLLDSILEQTYDNIEFILVNDGSTDNSEKIWFEYETLFQSKGIKTKYIYQENQGLGAAINAGLKVFTGEYLCWPDIDDYFERTSIEKRARFLEENKEFGSVSSDANKYMEDDLDHPVERMAGWMKHIKDEWQFKWMATGQSLFCPGCHMLRTSCFLDVNPERYIYPARRGQNNQMLLPIYYKYKHGYIDEPLYNYIIYNKSMSTPDVSEEAALDRIEEYIKVLKWTYHQIPLNQESKKLCYDYLKNQEWNGMAYFCEQFRKPGMLIRKYFEMKMYKTPLKGEYKRIIAIFLKKINLRHSI